MSHAPDTRPPLDPAALRDLPSPFHLEVVASAPSTNALVSERARAGEAEGLVLVAEHQTAGRGRLDREWVTPPRAAVTMSVLLRPRAAPGRWPLLGLLAGLVVADAVAAVGGPPVSLKWPNDVLVEGRKISGILAEVLPADPFAVIVGAGVNTAMTSADLPVSTATSFEAMGRVVDEDRLVADYLEGLRDGVAALTATLTAPAVKAAVRAVCTTLGRVVTVSLPDGSVLEGTAERIDDDGRLVVRAEGVEAVVAAGDVVHVR